MNACLMKNVLKSREDGYRLSKAGFRDYPACKKLLQGLSPQSKALYNPWMFDSSPGQKVRLGQWIARASLLPLLGSVIKFLFPYGYAVILKCEKEGELVGNMCLYNFRKTGRGSYTAKESKVVRDIDQGKGIAGFLTEAFIDQAIKERVELVISGTLARNEKNRKLYEKHGWKFSHMDANAHLDTVNSCYWDMEIWKLDLGSRLDR